MPEPSAAELRSALRSEPLALGEAPGEPGSELREALRSAIDREAAIVSDIQSINLAQTKLRASIATATDAKADLATLNTEHKAAVESWAANGASGPAPKRDETSFAEAHARLQATKSDIADSELALSTLDNQFQNRASELRDIGNRTNEIIVQIQLAEANRLLHRLDTVEAERKSLRAQLMGLVMLLQQVMLATSATRNNNPYININPQPIKDIETLRHRLETWPPDPSEVQCQDAKLNWQRFEQNLRTDSEATYHNGANGELP